MIRTHLLLAVLFVALFAIPAQAKGILVPTDHPTIQAAVDAALEGDEILLEPGTYTDPVVVPAVGLVIRSLSGNPADVILDGSGRGLFEAMILLDGDASGIRTVSDLTFHNAGPAVRMKPGSNPGHHVIRNCIFQECGPISPVTAGPASFDVLDCEFIDNEAYLFGGAVTFSGPARIMGNLFRNNTAVPYQGTDLTQGGAIYMLNAVGFEGSFAEIRDNVFEGNSCTDYGGAIHVGSNHTALIEGNQFIGNVADACAGGIYVSYNTQHQVAIENNLFVDNESIYGAAIGVDESRYTSIRFNTIVGSKLGEGIRLQGSSQNVVEGNIVVFGEKGGINWSGVSTGTQVCNNAYGNLTNYQGNVPAGNNYSLDPGFCDQSGSNYTLRADSPCLPENNDCSVLIGAFSTGCDAVPVQEITWGSLKRKYLRRSR